MARFNPYTLLTTNPELLNSTATFSVSSIAQLFSMNEPEIHNSCFYERITYRIRKLNQLLLSRGIRLVTHVTNPPTYSITNLTDDHPYVKSQLTLSRRSAIRNSTAISGVTNYSIGKSPITYNEYKLIKHMY
jgi:hypothetical protein